MFKSASDSASREYEARQREQGKIMCFGVEYLDHATRGIFPDDLVLLGAPSGMGKTQLCCIIALANMNRGHKVHYIALEASRYEIERRLKYPMICERYYKAPFKKGKLSYADWLAGKFSKELEAIEVEVAFDFEAKYKNLFLFYKQERFDAQKLVEAVSYASSETDLIIVDHVHYFDWDDESDNRAIKNIAITARDLALEQGKPIILVAHLRKRDRHNDELCAGLDEFHGSSELTKVATKVITIAPGMPNADGLYETYFRVAKNRIDSQPTRYVAREWFDPKGGGYAPNRYEIGPANQSRNKPFEQLRPELMPDWAPTRDSRSSGDERGGRDHAPSKRWT